MRVQPYFYWATTYTTQPLAIPNHPRHANEQEAAIALALSTPGLEGSKWLVEVRLVVFLIAHHVRRAQCHPYPSDATTQAQKVLAGEKEEEAALAAKAKAKERARQFREKKQKEKQEDEVNTDCATHNSATSTYHDRDQRQDH